LVTNALEQAFAVAAKLSHEEQDWLAKWILRELAEERRWNEAFSSSADSLARLADEALDDLRNRRAEPLDPERL
jgi:hypothetical protein